MTEVAGEYRTRAPSQTESIASGLARHLAAGDVVGLHGDLGSGKTCFVRGLVAGLKDADRAEVSSPTYALMNLYPTQPPVYHFDLYRVCGIDDLETTGYWDQIEEADGIVVVEWCGRVDEIADTLTWRVDLTVLGKHDRRLLIRRTGPHRAA